MKTLAAKRSKIIIETLEVTITRQLKTGSRADYCRRCGYPTATGGAVADALTGTDAVGGLPDSSAISEILTGTRRIND